MPGFYGAGEYDVAGFAVGSVQKDRVIDGSRIVAGDVLLGLPSSGVHSNGFSLVRRVLEVGCALSCCMRSQRIGSPFLGKQTQGKEEGKRKTDAVGV